MFELFKGVYSEKIEAGRYSIFNETESIRIFVNIEICMNPRKTARLIRNIARQIGNIKAECNTTKKLEGDGLIEKEQIFNPGADQ